MTKGPQNLLPASRRRDDPSPEEGPPVTEEPMHTLVHRVVLVLAAAGLFWGAFETYGNGLRYTWVGVLAVLGFIIPPLILTGVVCARTDRTLAQLDLAVLLAAIMVFLAWTWPAMQLFPQHQSDEASLVDYAAQMLRQGHNPYSSHLMGAYLQYPIPSSNFTPLISGSVADKLGYPPVPVLLSALFLPVVGSMSAMAFVGLLAMVVSMVLMFFLLPVTWRSLGVVLIVAMPAYNVFAFFGLTEVLLVPSLIVVAWRWDRIGAGGRLGAGGITKAVMLGIAGATQQLAWFIAPFLLVGVYLLRRSELDRRAALVVLARFAAIGAGVFLLIDFPFMVWGAGAWLAGVFAPITQHSVPIGNAFVGLAPIAHVGGGDLVLYSYAAFAAVVVLLAAYAMFFHRLGPACFMLPAVAMLLPTRSLAVYLMALATVWIVSLLTVDRARIAEVPPLLRGRVAPALRRWGIVGLALVPAAILSVALTTPGPLTMTITNLDAMVPGQFFRDLDVQVTNNSGDALQPHFMVTNAAETGSPFWTVVSGPQQLAPHASTQYVLAAPSGAYAPSDYTAFRLEAVTDQPETASWSDTYSPRPYFASMPVVPNAQDVAVGTSVPFTVQLQGPYDGPVQQAGVPVVFTVLEELPDPRGDLVPLSTFAIDGAPPGVNSLTLPTNADGNVTFRMRCVQPSTDVVVVSSWLLAQDQKTTFGNSEDVPIRCHV